MGRAAFILIIIAIILIGGYAILKGKKFGLGIQIGFMSATMLLNIGTMLIYDTMGNNTLAILWASVATVNALALAGTIRSYLIKRAEEKSKIKIASK